MTTRILSVRQPWAIAIMLFGKNIENRTWTTSYRGPVAIHVSKVEPSDSELSACAAIIAADRGISTSKAMALLLSEIDPRHYGCIIGGVHLISMIERNELTQSRWQQFGHYGFVFINQILFKQPIPVTGKLGLWRPDAELARVLTTAPVQKRRVV